MISLDLRSQWSPGRYAHATGICASYYCTSLKKDMGVGWYNADRGLISRDIAFLSDMLFIKISKSY